ncbi:MAG TPA: dethiobiotin synthase [Candidatus Acidoferrales bacterium]|nr:dethiobiotin synthase [Candidatus Acidoferrales bacterium]
MTESSTVLIACRGHFRFDITGMRQEAFFITGTDTGVGKTVLTALLARYLGENDIKVAALKPVCSGGRDDARVLHGVLNGAATLDQINPWHFRAPLAPLLAARLEHRRVRLAEVLAHVCAMQKRFDILLIEGAGGLLSPLGEDFNSRDLIAALRATPIVVCPNRLGAVNQALLTLEALPSRARVRARVVLMSPPGPDASTQSNFHLLAARLEGKRILRLPWLGARFNRTRGWENARVRQAVRALASSLQIFPQKVIAFHGRAGSNL